MPVDQKKLTIVADAVMKTCDRADALLSKHADGMEEKYAKLAYKYKDKILYNGKEYTVDSVSYAPEPTYRLIGKDGNATNIAAKKVDGPYSKLLS